MELIVGKAAKFEATVLGLPPPEIVWLRNEQPFEPNERVKLENKGNLKALNIKKTLAEDSGVYKIIATNEVGEDSCFANLNVTGMLMVIEALILYKIIFGQ